MRQLFRGSENNSARLKRKLKYDSCLNRSFGLIVKPRKSVERVSKKYQIGLSYRVERRIIRARKNS